MDWDPWSVPKLVLGEEGSLGELYSDSADRALMDKQHNQQQAAEAATATSSRSFDGQATRSNQKQHKQHKL